MGDEPVVKAIGPGRIYRIKDGSLDVALDGISLAQALRIIRKVRAARMGPKRKIFKVRVVVK